MSPKANSGEKPGAQSSTFPEVPSFGRNDFCVCRVLVGWALTTINSFDKLSTAKRFMHRIAARVPGCYVVFSRTSRRVLAKVGESRT
jgi:hypothetical protein